jgi:hypothetical protein
VPWFSYALGATTNPEWARETLDYALTHGRDQDLHSFFNGVAGNVKTRRVVTQFFKEHYDAVCIDAVRDSYEQDIDDDGRQLVKRYEGNFSFTYIVRVSAMLSDISLAVADSKRT